MSTTTETTMTLLDQHRVNTIKTKIKSQSRTLLSSYVDPFRIYQSAPWDDDVKGKRVRIKDTHGIHALHGIEGEVGSNVLCAFGFENGQTSFSS